MSLAEFERMVQKAEKFWADIESDKAKIEAQAASSWEKEQTSPGGEPPPAAGWGKGGAGQVP